MTTDMQRGPVLVRPGGGGQADTRGLAVARQVDREPRHEGGRDQGRGVDHGGAEDGVRMRRARGEKGQRLGGQLMMLDHEPVTSARVSDAGPGPVTTAGRHRQRAGARGWGHWQRPGVARGRGRRPSGWLRVVLRN